MGAWSTSLVAVLTQIAEFSVDRYTSGASLSQRVARWPAESATLHVAFYTSAGSV